MCITFFNFSSDRSQKPSVIIFNRDESSFRISESAEFWDEDSNILGGRDVLKGTWLGINIKTGNLAFLTNFSDAEYPIINNFNAVSRGKLIQNFLSTDFPSSFFSVETYIDFVLKNSKAFNPFNAVFGNVFSNDYFFCDIFGQAKISMEKNQMVGFSNNYYSMHTWPKVTRGIELLKNVNPRDFEAICHIMKDTCVDKTPEREISIFIRPYFVKEMYKLISTISTTVLVIDDKGVTFSERTYKIDYLSVKEFILKHNKNIKLGGLLKFHLFLAREKTFPIKTFDKIIKTEFKRI